MKITRYILLVLFTALLIICVIQLRAEPKQFFEDNSSKSRQELFEKGTSFIKKEMPDSALAYFALAARGYGSNNLSKEEQQICAKALTNAGYVHFFFFQDYPAAYSAFLSSNDIAEKEGLTRIACMNDLNIGNVYSIYKDYREASQMYKKAFNSAKRNGFSDLMMMAFIDLADVYYNEQGLIAPMRDELAALGSDTLPRSHPLTPYTRNVYYGLLSADRGDKMAGRWFEQAKDSVGSIHLGERYAYNADFMISRILQHNGKPAQAADRLRLILQDSAIGANQDVEAMVYQRMADYYAEAGMSDSAQLYKMKYLEMSDSIFATQKLTAVKNLTASHERQELTTQITRMTEAQTFHRRILTCICVALAVVILLMIWSIYKNRQLKSSNEELYKRNRELLALSERDLLAPGETAGVPTTAETDADGDDPELPVKSGATEQKGKLSPDSEYMRELRRKILEVMESDEIFSPDFNSSRLAALCDSNTRYLSAALSGSEDETLPVLLSRFRVREAMRRLASTSGKYSNLTIEAIGESVGFKTRSTFSATFKRVTGLSPKDYRKISMETGGE